MSGFDPTMYGVRRSWERVVDPSQAKPSTKNQKMIHSAMLRRLGEIKRRISNLSLGSFQGLDYHMIHKVLVTGFRPDEMSNEWIGPIFDGYERQITEAEARAASSAMP